MTKKPPKTLWVNVYRETPNLGLYAFENKVAAQFFVMRSNPEYVGTFKYVLEEKGKKK